MLALKKCSFCSRGMELGVGVMYVLNDGSSRWFCSSKCRKNALKLGRDPRRLKWASSKKKEERKEEARKEVAQEKRAESKEELEEEGGKKGKEVGEVA